MQSLVNRRSVCHQVSHLSSETHPETGTTSYTYNGDGTLATKTDAKGQKTKYIYDSYKRVTQIQYFPNGTNEDTCQRMTITYDINNLDGSFTQNGWGRQTTAQWGGSVCFNGNVFTQMYSYTAGGLATAKRLGIARSNLTQNLDAGYGYDNEGHVTSIMYPTAYVPQLGSNPPVLQAGPTYTYTLDVMGRPVTMTSNQDAGTLAQNVIYNAADQITRMDRTGGGDSVSETRSYNALLQLTALSASHGAYSYGYAYSSTQNNGRIVQSTDAVAGQTINYTYDTLNRLSSASGTGWGESYTYDGFGNLTDKTPTSGSPPVLHVAVNAANNHLVGYTYDANGNMAGMGGTSFTYDVANRIATVLPSGGGTERYSYGPDNLRVWKLAADGTEELHFYGVFGERLGTYPIRNFSPYGNKVFQGPIDGYFAGKIIWSQQTGIDGSVVSGTGREVAQNRLGSVAGSYPNGSYYYPYGEDTGTSLLGDNFGTYYRDGTTGLDYAKNRYYSPILGRFLSPDLGNPGYLSNPQSLNRYAYVLDDPINSRDPEGLCTVMIGGITQTPYTPDVTAQQDVAESLGAISAFPYAGGNQAVGIGNILAQGAGVPTGAVLTTLEAISLAAQNKGPIDIIAYSGGAQSFTSAWNYLNADAKSRIESITYVDPATTGTLTAGNPGTTVKVLEDDTGFANTALQFLGSGKPTSPNPPGAEYVDTGGCGHNANCVFAKFLDWFGGSSCKIGAGGVFGAPTSRGVQVIPITGSLTGPPAMVYWWSLPGVPSVTEHITYDVP